MLTLNIKMATTAMQVEYRNGGYMHDNWFWNMTYGSGMLEDDETARAVNTWWREDCVPQPRGFLCLFIL